MQIMKININFFAASIISLIISLPLFGQEVSLLKKKVVNTYNQGIQGATIITQDEKFQTLTTRDGSFELPEDYDDQMVIISAPGYQNIKLPMKNLIEQSSITLTFDPHHMGGKVNFGYKSYSKESITGAVSSVTGEELNNAPTNVLSEALQARLPGL